MADLLSVALANAELFETMRQAEWRFRTLFRAAPDAVLTVLQTTGRIREANDAVRDVFGLEPHQVIGRTLRRAARAGRTARRSRRRSRTRSPDAPARVEVHVADARAGTTRVVALAGEPPARSRSAERAPRRPRHDAGARDAVRLMESDRSPPWASSSPASRTR